MPIPNLDKRIDKLKREISISKRAVALSCILIVAIQVAYTNLSISHEQATRKKALYAIPHDPVAYMIYLASKHKANIAFAKDSLNATQ